MNNYKAAFKGKTIELQEICDSITDCHHSTPMYTNEGKIVIRNYNVKNGRMLLDNVSYTDDEHFNQRILRETPNPGDLIITREAPMGEVCIIPEGIECCLGQRMVLIKPNTLLTSNKFLLYALLSEYVQEQINKSNGTGSIVSNLRIPVLKSLKIPYFDLQTQKQIAKVLSDLDAKIEVNNKINQELEAMAKTLYDYWFVQFDFPDVNGNPYKSSGGKMVFNEELKREIPEGWSFDYVENLLAKEKSTKKVLSQDYKSQGKIPIIDQSTNFIAGFTDDLNSIVEAKLPRIIFGDHTRILKLINFDFARGADGTQVLLSNNESVPQHLLYHSLLKIDLSNYGYARHFKFLKATKILIPNKDISQTFEEIARGFYNKIRHNIFENQKLSELRDWLLPMLMNGQVRIAHSHEDGNLEEVESEFGPDSYREVAEEHLKYGEL